MLNLRCATYVAAAAVVMLTAVGASAQSQKKFPIEAYIEEPLPSVVQILGTEVDGPVFATAQGRTLYVWPENDQNDQGVRGEREGKPTCTDTVTKVTAGFHEPYPPNLIEVDVATRPACTSIWPPFYADADAKPVGKWTVIDRPDGRKQWAYEGLAAYTSFLDREPGQVFGSGKLHAGGDSGAKRKPIGPEADVPAQFEVVTVPLGRMLTTITGFSVYTWDRDGNNKSNCDASCQQSFAPVLAHASAPRLRGDWGVIERSPGVFQWTYRKRPLYTLIGEEQRGSFHGSDIAGWRNVFTQAAPAFPKGFTVQDAPGGQVLANADGRTIYIYTCVDDTLDQQICDHPALNQKYRLAVCGGFDKKRCAEQFPYVTADASERSTSQIWAIKTISTDTGTYVDEGAPNSARIWTYRDRPVYYFFKDKIPGDTYGDSWGENNGWINGFHAFFTREEYRKQYLDTSGSGRR